MTRRRGMAGVPDPESPLSMCMGHALKAGAADDPDIAREEAQKALFYLLDHLGGAVAPLTDAPGDDRRTGWIAALRLLDGVPNAKALTGLSLALSELGRGVTAPALEPVGTRQGGKATTPELEAMQAIVEAADALKADLRADAPERPLPGQRAAVAGTSVTDRYEAALRDAGSSRQLVEQYRTKLLNGAPDVHPRPLGVDGRPIGYVLRWGDADPRDVLRRAAQALAAVRRG